MAVGQKVFRSCNEKKQGCRESKQQSKSRIIVCGKKEIPPLLYLEYRKIGAPIKKVVVLRYSRIFSKKITSYSKDKKCIISLSYKRAAATGTASESNYNPKKSHLYFVM